jgi:hypothetical protein
VNLIDNNFKLPQVARFNLAADVRLPGGINATFEGMYSKTINNVFYQDINLAAPAASLILPITMVQTRELHMLLLPAPEGLTQISQMRF